MHSQSIHSHHTAHTSHVQHHSSHSSATGAIPTESGLDIEPWDQWNANDGYCGESAMLSAGLYYGQYISQYDIRALAIQNTPGSEQNNDEVSFENNQTPPEDNTITAANAMHMTSNTWDGQGTTQDYLNWIQQNVAAGHPVMIGVYMNNSVFGDVPNYDFNHLVLVTGIDLTKGTITFSDNGFYTGDGAHTNHTYTFPLSTFLASRQQANKSSADIYSMPDDRRDYGIALTGVTGDSVPIQVTTNKNKEPPMSDGSNKRPHHAPLDLSVTLSDLTPGKTYTIYRYDSMSKVPDSDFNAHKADADQSWTFTATGTTYTMNETIQSNETAVYRAVPSDEQ